MTLVKQLRDAALLEPRWKFRAALKGCADRIAAATAEFAMNATEDNLRVLNGVWATGVHWLKKAQEVPDPTPTSGAGEVKQEQRAA